MDVLSGGRGMEQKTVMIVEDEVIVGMDLKNKVEKLGYLVDSEIIRYGEKVLEAAKNVKPDLILMDIRLKGEMDGTQAASLVQEELGLPVIFLTAYSDQATLSRAKAAEPYAYLKKPVRGDDLRISLELSLYRAEMQKRVKDSELRMRTIADYTYDWETWISPDGTYIYCSPSCERITGYTADRIMMNPDFFLSMVHPDERYRVEKELEAHLSSKSDDCFSEFRVILPDGKERWIEHYCRPVFDASGGYIGRRASNRDISARKFLELELENKVAELKEALDNIKTLKGLIPICARCKKIRDDKGYWNMLESYIQARSEATFSHSMCPVCMDECYGDEDWYQKMKTKYDQDSNEKKNTCR